MTSQQLFGKGKIWSAAVWFGWKETLTYHLSVCEVTSPVKVKR